MLAISARSPDDVKTEAAFAPGLVSGLLGPAAWEARRYDERAAYLLSVASAWAYSDTQTLCDVMHRLGLQNYCQTIIVGNDALFVDANASIVQSQDGDLAILCFRGTAPRNIISWLTDASVEAERFRSWGDVHGGIYRNVMAMWPYIQCRLGRAVRGLPVVDDPASAGGVAIPSCRPAQGAEASAMRVRPLRSLYITGHSLGGAMAVIAAALLFADEINAEIRSALRGVYTFGQPMVGGEAFSAACERAFGDITFRHVYQNDLVPRFPPRSAGRFEHFGRELASVEDGWQHRPKPVSQTYTFLASSAIGVLSWLGQQLPILGWMRMPFSWGDHSPLHYMRCSQRSLRVLGSELG